MKTIEEKAKRYDKVLEQAKNWYVDAQLDFKKSLETLLPELKESEDEKISKLCKELIESAFMNELCNKEERDTCIAWLEKQGEEKKITHKEVSNANKDEVIRCLINGMKFYYEDNAEATWGTEKFSMKVKDILSWLEKQDTERKQLYVRFGDIPSNEKSKIYHGEEEIGDENGVSVYPAFELNGNIVLGLTLPITKTTLYTQQHLLEYDNRPCYLVSGDYVGKGTDGEPLIKNISVIKRLDNYRIKECEKKPVIEMITPEESLGIDSETYNDIVNTCIFGENKPKFKVDDWITDGQIICKILGITGKSYELHLYNDYCHFETDVQSVNEHYHLWTIQDAKNGDVLAADTWSDYPSSFVAIYKKQNGEDFDSYCFVGFDGKFYKGENGHSTEEIHPATKEQCDLLFQKMKEEGYEWDGKKKELKKIEQKSATMSLDEAIEHCKEKSCGNNACTLEHKQLEKWLTELKELKEQKPAWSEEDERNFNDTILFIETGTYSLDKDNLINWLKSLRPKNTWKPSDEQINNLKQAINAFPYETDYLELLYDDLKKLK